MRRFLATLVAVLTVPAAAAQGIDLVFTAGDGTTTQEVRLGLDPAATNGLDGALGEAELPPFPPAGVFEARFVGANVPAELGQGSYRDYRAGTADFTGSVEHALQWQLGSGASAFVLGYDLPAGVTVLAEDFFGGVVLSETLTGAGELRVTNTSLTQAKLTVTYEGDTPPNTPPVFTSAAVTAGQVGAAYAYTVTASDADGDALALTAPTLPDWLSFTDNGGGSGSLGGTPAEAGDFDVVLRASDGTDAVEQHFTITAAATPNTPPAFTSASVASGEVGAAYMYAVTATDGDGDPLTLSAPTLPGWLSFTDHGDETGTLAGTPTVAGDYDVVLRASDGTDAVEQRFVITVVTAPPTEENVAGYLLGVSEVPAVATDAAGFIEAARTGNDLQITGSFAGLTGDYSASHLHLAPAGGNGPAFVSLSPMVGADNRSGTFDETVALDAAQVNALRAGEVYLNVHSDSHPSGELRAQLTPDPEVAEVTLLQARNIGPGVAVAVSGTVSRAMGAFTYIQDTTGGLVIRQTAGAFSGDVAAGTITGGTTVAVTGALSEFSALLQINDGDLEEYSITGETAVPEPRLVTLAGIAANAEAYESMLLRVREVTFVDAGSFAERTNYAIDDGSGGDVSVRVINAGDTEVDGLAIPTASTTITGVLGQFDRDAPFADGYQLQPILGSDVEAATDSAIDLAFSAGDGTTTQEVRLGLDPAATNGLDGALGEAELPPFPPAGVFEARFVGANVPAELGQGSYRDYRAGTADFTGSVEHALQWQLGSGASAFVLGYDLPAGVTVLAEDFFGGVVLSETLTGAGELRVTNTSLTQAKLTVTYEGDTPPNTPPVFTSAAVTAGQVGAAYAYTVTASDADGDALALTAPTLPDWLSFTDNGGGSGSLGGTPAEAGDFDVVLRASDGTDAVEQSYTITVADAPPPNDSVDHAIAISGGGSYTGSNVLATLEAGEPVPSCASLFGASVFWEYTAGVRGTLDVSLDGSGFDTVLTLHAPDSLSELACNDDFGESDDRLQSDILGFPIDVGTRVVIRVGGYDGAQGGITMTITENPATDLGDDPNAAFALSAPQPNPVGGAFQFTLQTPAPAEVRVVLFDMLGRAVRTVHDGPVAAGRTEHAVDTGGLPSGQYLLRASCPSAVSIQSVTVIR